MGCLFKRDPRHIKSEFALVRADPGLLRAQRVARPDVQFDGRALLDIDSTGELGGRLRQRTAVLCLVDRDRELVFGNKIGFLEHNRDPPQIAGRPKLGREASADPEIGPEFRRKTLRRLAAPTRMPPDPTGTWGPKCALRELST